MESEDRNTCQYDVVKHPHYSGFAVRFSVNRRIPWEWILADNGEIESFSSTEKAQHGIRQVWEKIKAKRWPKVLKSGELT